MLLHAYTVSENRAAGVRARGVDGDNSHTVTLLAIKARQVIDQRALPCSRGPRQADHAGPASVREERLEQIGPSGSAILNHGDNARQSPDISGAERTDQGLDVAIRSGVQATSVKQD